MSTGCGQSTAPESPSNETVQPSSPPPSRAEQLPKDPVARAIYDALNTSLLEVEGSARAEIAAWFDFVEGNVDPSFLNLHFEYWHTNLGMLFTVYGSAIRSADSAQAEAAREMINEIGKDFSRRALMPEKSRLALQALAQAITINFVEYTPIRLA
ncbi:MAG: hypothetical protein AAF492_23125, partial [Verrucomicrobiota bacterium]